jgi:hypothetical protein
MTQEQQGDFNNLLYKYFADKTSRIFNTKTITSLETQEDVSKAIFNKIESSGMSDEDKNKAYASFEPFFPEKP